MYILQKTIDIDRNEITEIKAIEHDTKTRFINFKFIGSNKVIDLSNCKVRIYAINSKCQEVFNDLTIVDSTKGIAQLELTDGLLRLGTTEYQLKIIPVNGGQLSSNIMRIIVDKNLMSDNAIESSNEYTALENALKNIDNIDLNIKDAKDKANNALSTANTVKEENKNINKNIDYLKNNTIKKTNRLDDCDLAPKKLMNFDTGIQADLMFYVDDNRNQQGLTYGLDHFYIGFDVGNNQGDIVKYTKSGVRVASTGNIGIGHAAGLGFRESNGKIYVANGGGSNPTHVYEVDFNNKRVTRDINLERYGTAALLAIDNDHDRLILHTSPGGNNGRILFNIMDFNGNSIVPQFEIPNQGIPQGLEYYNGILYYYTNDKVTCINIETHEIMGHFSIKKAGESEGITLVRDGATPYLAIGYNGANRIYSIRTNEAQQFSTPSMFNLMYRNDNPSKCLIPKILAFSLQRNPDTSWGLADWGNGATKNLGNLFSAINYTDPDDEVRAILKVPFKSIAFMTGDADWQLGKAGIEPRLNLESDGVTIRICFIDRNNNYVKIRDLPAYADVRCLLIGGVDINY
ncbi:BppU family phage baseplate upper protein [Clostridium sardiniense]|uniref:BppU family phage baseplate upper protein n=1 Tax=Clostridium sardiniense TaxID=29369 RepID=UPI00195D3A1E|nr:BppU family phage baseplate upper protein [Clostridium sardiniense]MBM7836447.1 hypothetical protein [Clostridium sardiniense]